MKKKYILPATFVLALILFVLIGRSGKPPTAVRPPNDPRPPDPLPPNLPIDEPMRAISDDENPAPQSSSYAAAARLVDVPWRNTRRDFVVAPLPRIKCDIMTGTIPIDWVDPRAVDRNLPPRVVSWNNLDHVPHARLQPGPVYPSALRHQHAEGMVMVEFLGDEMDNVYSPVVLSATTPGFEEAARHAVARCKFEPGSKRGRRVRFHMSVPLVFRIGEE
jgi:TonB family protein